MTKSTNSCLINRITSMVVLYVFRRSEARSSRNAQPDLVVPADRVLRVPQGEDSVNGTVSQQVFFQLLYRKHKQPSVRGNSTTFILTRGHLSQNSLPQHPRPRWSAPFLPVSQSRVRAWPVSGKEKREVFSWSASRSSLAWPALHVSLFLRGVLRAFRWFQKMLLKTIWRDTPLTLRTPFLQTVSPVTPVG